MYYKILKIKYCADNSAHAILIYQNIFDNLRLSHLIYMFFQLIV